MFVIVFENLKRRDIETTELIKTFLKIKQIWKGNWNSLCKAFNGPLGMVSKKKVNGIFHLAAWVVPRWPGILLKQAQICAEGCEEDNITHIFQI